MDEPLGALDKQLREQLQIEIKHIHANLGVTVIYVTHDQSEALTLSNRVAVFNDGSIQQVAPPMDLYRYPETAFVANFVGENNQFTCSIIDRRGPNVTVAAPNGDRFSAVAVGDLGTGSSGLASIRPSSSCSTRPRACASLPQYRKNSSITATTCASACAHRGEKVITSKVMRPDGTKAPEIGRSVAVGWRPDDCRVFAVR